MKIITQFEINNLVKHKFHRPTKDKFMAMEIIEIQATTCYGGTQVFYHCRGLHAERIGFREEKEWIVGHGSTQSGAEYMRVREDEIVALSDEEIAIITGAKTS